MSRRDDLEALIHDSYSIVRDNERILQTSDSPKEKLRVRRELEEQWGHIERYLAEYRSLVGDIPQAIAEIAARSKPGAGRTIARATRNLPPLSPHFLGRRAEIDALKSWFGSHHSPVALVGMGGIGKTSLAVAAIREMDRFADGVVWVDGYQHTTAGTLVMRLGELLCLDMSYRTAAEQRQAVHSALNGLDTLVVVDNLEAVSDLPATADLLRGLPCDVLVIGRERWVEFPEPFEVQPLADDAAPALFVASSRKCPADDPDIVALCNHDLGGHPLAIEVMAAWAEAGISPGELRELLRSEPLEVLGDAVEGKSVVRALSLSFRQLTPLAQQALVCASVFFDEFTLDSLAALMPDQRKIKLAGAMRELTSRSLAQSQDGGKYRLHPVIRQYAYGQLAEPVEYHRRTAEYYAGLRTPPETWKSIEDLQPQLQEFEHRVRAEDYQKACLLVDKIHFSLGLWGYESRLVEMGNRLVDKLGQTSTQALNLNNLALSYRNLGQFELAVESSQKALGIAQRIGDTYAQGWSLGVLGLVHRDLGEIELAIKHYEEVLELAQTDGNILRELTQLDNLGLAHYIVGDFEQAIEKVTASAQIIKQVLVEPVQAEKKQSGLDVVSLTNQHLSGIAHHYGDLSGVLKSRLGCAYRVEGACRYALGELDRAIELYRDALDIFYQINDLRRQVIALGFLGKAYYAVGKLQDAQQVHEQSLRLAQDIGYKAGESHSWINLGRILIACGEFAQAYQYVLKALELQVPATACETMMLLGIICLSQRDPDTIWFENASECCKKRLKSPRLYETRYTLALSSLGQIVTLPTWNDRVDKPVLLAPALAEYRHALDNCSAKGVVQDAIRDLELIQKAGIEGLEPVFELLRSHLEGGPV